MNFNRLEMLMLYNSMLVVLFGVFILSVTLASDEMEPFVVGGDYTDIKQYAHSILMIVDCIDPYLCGGSVLTEHIVLTAGHCLNPCANAPDFTILLKHGHQTQKYMVSSIGTKFVTHSGYNDITLENDIGLVYTDVPMALGRNVKRISVFRKYFRHPRYAYVAGWGIINSKGETAASLKYVRQPFPSEDDCSSLVRSSPGIICAGGKYQTGYPDQGDSGSALVAYDFIQIGIVSFKHPDYGLIGYTNTTYYYNWIVGTSELITCT